MAGGVERCACGAEVEISEAHYTQVVAFVNAWRKQHVCKVRPSTEIQAMHGGESRTELPSTGFSVNIIPSEEEEERRR
jgi:hypothetical protein